VTEANKGIYVKRMIDHLLKGKIQEQIQEFRKGFHALVPIQEISFFKPSELDLLICGVPDINVQDFHDNCEYLAPYFSQHPVIITFWKVLSNWNNERLARLLIFMTGSSQVPLGGFRTCKDTTSPITIGPGGSHDKLPSAHTCTNTLNLPAYEDEAELERKLLTSIYECNTFECH
jgi:hypothetical protein